MIGLVKVRSANRFFKVGDILEVTSTNGGPIQTIPQLREYCKAKGRTEDSWYLMAKRPGGDRDYEIQLGNTEDYGLIKQVLRYTP